MTTPSEPDTPPPTRTCKVCATSKPLDEFSTYKARKGPYRLRTCIPCRAYVEKNREEINRRVRVDRYIRYHTDPGFREKLKESSRRTSKEYYEKNREKILARRRERRKTKSG